MLLAVAAAATRLTRVVVQGASMEPTLLDGDRLIVLRGLRPRRGALLALHDPRDPQRLLVKRVLAVGRSGIEVRGDAPDRSTDSRTFGPVADELVVGRVVWRYHPSERAGRVAAGPAGHLGTDR